MIDELVAAGLPALTVLGIGAVIGTMSAAWFGFWGNPVTAFLGSWVPMGIVLAMGWMTFHSLQPDFLFIVASATAAFLFGALAGARPRPAVPPAVRIDACRFLQVLRGTALVGLVGFLGFVAAVVWQVGWGGLLQRPHELRLAMNTEEFSDPTKLLHYATMLIPVLVVIGREAGICLGAQWSWVAGLALVSNLVSTGRTRIIWTAMWCGFCLLLARERRSPRLVWKVATVGSLFALTAFWLIGAWLGKGFPVHEQGKWMPEMPEPLVGLATVFFYLGVNLPYLQEALALAEPAPPPLNHLLLPYYKTISFILAGVPVPSEILELHPLPYPANTGTWLVQFAFDAGVAGVLVFPCLVGLLGGWLVTNPRWGDADPFRLFFGGLLLTVIWLGFIGNKLLSTPTWLFVGFGLTVLPWVRGVPSPGQQREAGAAPRSLPGTIAAAPPG